MYAVRQSAVLRSSFSWSVVIQPALVDGLSDSCPQVSLINNPSS